MLSRNPNQCEEQSGLNKSLPSIIFSIQRFSITIFPVFSDWLNSKPHSLYIPKIRLKSPSILISLPIYQPRPACFSLTLAPSFDLSLASVKLHRWRVGEKPWDLEPPRRPPPGVARPVCNSQSGVSRGS